MPKGNVLLDDATGLRENPVQSPISPETGLPDTPERAKNLLLEDATGLRGSGRGDHLRPGLGLGPVDTALNPDEFKRLSQLRPGDNHFERRARSQTTWDLISGASTQALAIAVGGTIENFGHLLDLFDPKFHRLVSEGKREFEDNFISIFGRRMQDLARERRPVYMTERAEEGFKPGDATWWASHVPSIFSSIGLLIPGGLVGKGAGMAAQALKLSRAAQGGARTISASLASRHMYSSLESMELYERRYEELRNRGFGVEESLESAATASGYNYIAGYMNLYKDLLAWSVAFKHLNFASKTVSDRAANFARHAPRNSRAAQLIRTQTGQMPPWLRGSADFLKVGFAEGLEEVNIQYQKKLGERWADMIMGLDTDDPRPGGVSYFLSSFTDGSVPDHLRDRHTWDSFFWGFMGGMVFGGLSKPAMRAMNPNERANTEREIRNIEDQLHAVNNSIDSYVQALEEGDTARAEVELATLFGNVNLDALSRGTLEINKEIYQSIIEASPEALQEMGMQEGAQEVAERALDHANRLETVFNREMNVERGEYGHVFAKKIAHLEVDMDLTREMAQKYETEFLQEFETTSQYKSLSDTGRERALLRNREIALIHSISAQEQALADIQGQKRSTGTLENNSIEALKDAIQSQKEILKEVQEARKAADAQSAETLTPSQHRRETSIVNLSPKRKGPVLKLVRSYDANAMAIMRQTELVLINDESVQQKIGQEIQEAQRKAEEKAEKAQKKEQEDADKAEARAEEKKAKSQHARANFLDNNRKHLTDLGYTDNHIADMEISDMEYAVKNQLTPEEFARADQANKEAGRESAATDSEVTEHIELSDEDGAALVESLFGDTKKQTGVSPTETDRAEDVDPTKEAPEEGEAGVAPKEDAEADHTETEREGYIPSEEELSLHPKDVTPLDPKEIEEKGLLPLIDWSGGHKTRQDTELVIIDNYVYTVIPKTGMIFDAKDRRVEAGPLRDYLIRMLDMGHPHLAPETGSPLRTGKQVTVPLADGKKRTLVVDENGSVYDPYTTAPVTDESLRNLALVHAENDPSRHIKAGDTNLGLDVAVLSDNRIISLSESNQGMEIFKDDPSMPESAKGKRQIILDYVNGEITESELHQAQEFNESAQEGTEPESEGEETGGEVPSDIDLSELNAANAPNRIIYRSTNNPWSKQDGNRRATMFFEDPSRNLTGTAVEFSVSMDKAVTDALPKEIADAYRAKKPIEKRGNEYFIDGLKISEEHFPAVAVVPLNENGSPVIIDGHPVRAFVRQPYHIRKSKTIPEKMKRGLIDQLLENRVRVYNAAAAGNRVQGKIAYRGSGFPVVNRTEGGAPQRNNVLTFIKESGFTIKNDSFGVLNNDSLPLHAEGEFYLEVNGQPGNFILFIPGFEGRRYPHKLNVRKINSAEAGMAVNLIQDWLTGKVNFGDMIETSDLSGITVGEFFDLLVFHGRDKTNIYTKHPADYRRGRVMFFDETGGNRIFRLGDKTFTADTVQQEGVAKIIAGHLRSQKNRQIDRRGLGADFKISHITGRSEPFVWFGQKINPAEKGSYLRFLFQGAEPAATTDATGRQPALMQPNVEFEADFESSAGQLREVSVIPKEEQRSGIRTEVVHKPDQDSDLNKGKKGFRPYAARASGLVRRGVGYKIVYGRPVEVNVPGLKDTNFYETNGFFVFQETSGKWYVALENSGRSLGKGGDTIAEAVEVFENLVKHDISMREGLPNVIRSWNQFPHIADRVEGTEAGQEATQDTAEQVHHRPDHDSDINKGKKGYRQYTIHIQGAEGPTFGLVYGKPVDIGIPELAEFNFFIYQREDRKWIVTEERTGQSAGAQGLTQKDAIAFAQDKLREFVENKGAEKVQAFLKGLPAVQRPEVQKEIEEVNKAKDQLDEKFGDHVDGVEGDDIVRFRSGTPPRRNLDNSIADEAEAIKKIIPANVPVNIDSNVSLIAKLYGHENPSSVWGIFAEAMIFLHENAPEGTAYHEAFHAVFNLALTQETRNKIYKEAEALYFERNNKKHENDRQLEEFLSDEFSVYMLSDGQYSVRQGQEIQGFFQRVWQWIKNFFSSRHNVDNLFANIRAGAYSQPVQYSSEFIKGLSPRFKDESDVFTPQVKNAIVRSIAYNVAAKAKFEISDDATQIDLTRVPNIIKGYFDHYRNNSDIKRASVWAEALHPNTLPKIQRSVEEFFAQMGIVGKKYKAFELETLQRREDSDLTERDYEKSDHKERLFIPTAYEYSNWDRAGANVRLMVAMLPKINRINPDGTYEYAKNEVTGEAEFTDAARSWNILLRELTNTSRVGKETKWDALIRKVRESARYEPALEILAKRLEGKDLPQSKKNEFFNVFGNLSAMKFHTLLYGMIPQTESFSVAFFESDLYRSGRRTANNWRSNIRAKLFDGVGGDMKLNVGRVSSAVRDYTTFRNKYAKRFSMENLDELVGILSEVGIDMDVQTMQYFFSQADSIEGAAKELFTTLDRIFTSEGQWNSFNEMVKRATAAKPVPGVTLYSSENPTFNSAFTKLAELYYINNPGLSEGTVLSAEGKSKWLYSDSNYYFDEFQRLKENPEYRDKVMKERMMGKLRILNALAQPAIARDMEYTVVDNVRSREPGDEGRAFADSRVYEEFVQKYASINRGVLPAVVFSDKKTSMGLKGLNFNRLGILLEFQDQHENPVRKITSSMVISETLLEQFSDYMANEIHRIYQVQQDQDIMSPENMIENYHYTFDQNGNMDFASARGRQFVLFPQLSKPILEKSNPKLAELLYGQGTMVNPYSDQMKALIRQEASRFITQAVTQEFRQLRSNRFIRDDGFLNAPLIDSRYIDYHFNPKDKDLRRELEKYHHHYSVIATAAINSLAFTMEQGLLMHGDPAYFKNYDDFRKRASGPAAFRRSLNTADPQVRSHYRMAIARDVIKPSDYIEAIQASLEGVVSPKKLKRLLKAYQEINTTDAQAIITLDRAVEILRGEGKWLTKFDPILAKWKKGNVDVLNSRTGQDMKKLFLTPFKGVHYGKEQPNPEVNLRNPVYLKYSQLVLLPGMIEQSANLRRIHDIMKRDNIDEMVFESGVKAGRRAKADVSNLETAELTANVLSNENWGRQVETPTKGVTDNALDGTQARRIVMLGLRDGRTYKDGRTHHQVQEEYVNAVSEFARRGLQDLESDLGAEFTEGRGVGKIRRMDRFAARMKKEAESRNAPENVIDAFDIIDNHLRVELELNPKSRQAQSIFMSLYKNDVVRRDVHGGSFVQASSFGFKSYAALTPEQKESIIVAPPEDAAPKPRFTMAMKFKDGDGGRRMRSEFQGKSTMDLILEGKRTATSRKTGKGIQKGDIIKFEGDGREVYVQATTREYSLEKVTPEQWSELEGWVPEQHEPLRRQGYVQFQYKVVSEKAAAQSAQFQYPGMPEFNRLPARSTTPTMTYAGIGSRNTPSEVLQQMTEVAQELEKQGYTLRTGNAKGADSAFREGARKREVYFPKDATDRTRAIAREIHPNPAALARTTGAIDNMARNTNQVFGRDLNSPVDFVLAWTPDGLTHHKERTRESGGTGQAIDMASRKGIPVINLADPNWKAQLYEIILDKGTDTQRTVEIPSEGLRPPIMMDGKVMAAQVLAPSWFGDIISRILKKDPSTLSRSEIREFFRDSPELLQFIGYRIPTQSLASIEYLEVVGFLPQDMGDTMVVFEELTSKNDSDFDVDKMYGLMPQFKVERNKVVPYKFYEDTNSTNQLRQMYDDHYWRHHKARQKLTKLDRIRTLRDQGLTPQAIMDEVARVEYDEKRQRWTVEGVKEHELEHHRKKLESTPTEREFIDQNRGKNPFEVNSIEAVWNKRIQLLVEIMQNPEVMAESLTPIVNPEFVDQAKKLTELIERQDTAQGAMEFLPSTQIEVGRRFRSGQNLVGILANHITSHAISTRTHLSLNHSWFLFNFAADSNREVVKDENDKPVPVVKLQSYEDYRAEDIMEQVSTMMSGFLDATADSWALNLNLTDDTANIAALLLRSGAGWRRSLAFLNQPVIRELAVLKPLVRDKVLSIGKPETYLRRHYYDQLETALKSEEQTGPVSELIEAAQDRGELKDRTISELLNENNLVENLRISGQKTTVQYYYDQIQLLRAYQEMETYSAALANFVTATKFDVDMPSSFAELTVNDLRIREALDSGILETGGYIQSSFLHSFQRSYNSARSLADGLHLGTSMFGRSVMNEVMYNLGEAFRAGRDVSTIEAVHNAITTYVIQSQERAGEVVNPVYRTTEQMSEMFQEGGNTIARRLIRVKEKLGKGVNPLVDYLQPNIHPGRADFVETGYREKGVIFTNSLIRGWQELMGHSDPAVRSFANDLVPYAYATSRMQRGMNTLHDLIPAPVLTEVSTFLREWKRSNANNAKLISSESIQQVAREIYRNEYRNEYLVPNINPKRMPPGVRKSIMDTTRGKVISGFDIPLYLLPTGTKKSRMDGSTIDAYPEVVQVAGYLYKAVTSPYESTTGDPGEGGDARIAYAIMEKKGFHDGSFHIYEYFNPDQPSIVEQNRLPRSVPFDHEFFLNKTDLHELFTPLENGEQREFTMGNVLRNPIC